MEIVRKCVEQIDVPFQLRGKQYFATSNWTEDFYFYIFQENVCNATF